MKVFLIRHGETEGNLDSIRPSKLTDKGKKQIAKISEGLVNIKLDVIYSSSSERALDTAKVINKNFKTKLIIDDVFSEIYRAIVGGPPKETRPGRFEEKFDLSGFYQTSLRELCKKIRLCKVL